MMDMLLPAMRVLVCPCQDLLYVGSLDILLLATDIDMPLPGPPICWIIGYTPPCYGYWYAPARTSYSGYAPSSYGYGYAPARILYGGYAPPAYGYWICPCQNLVRRVSHSQLWILDMPLPEPCKAGILFPTMVMDMGGGGSGPCHPIYDS